MTPKQLEALRAVPLDVIATPNRLAIAFAMTRLKQDAAVEATGIAQARISALVCGRGGAATVHEGLKLARFFGCELVDLFPEPAEERLAS